MNDNRVSVTVSHLITHTELQERLCVSRSTIQRMMRSGILQAGKHYIRTSAGERSPLRFNYEAIVETAKVATFYLNMGKSD